MCMSVADAENVAKARDYLNELVELARLPASTQVIVSEVPFYDALREFPGADINFLGLPNDFNQGFFNEVIEITGAACLFVRDSGDESALA